MSQIALTLEETREVERFYNSEACRKLLDACFSEVDMSLDGLRDQLLNGPELDRDQYYLRRDALDAQKAAVVHFESKLNHASQWSLAKQQQETEQFQEAFTSVN